jgi:hypothetical protein
MGAVWFAQGADGATADEAFANARARAGAECGHGGYTGTVVEKRSFREVKLPEGMTVNQFVNLLEDPSELAKHGLGWAYEKDGPAACVKVRDGRWAFFGWASW